MTDSTYFAKSTPIRAFTGSFQHFADMLVILRKKYNAEKYFLTNLRVFKLSHFQTTAPSKLWLIVHTL